MYPSVVTVPFAMAAIGVIKHFAGPAKTREMTHRLAARIRAHVPARRVGLEPDDMRYELCFIGKCRIPPRIACFETACAFDLWLAAHGQQAKVCLGKRVEQGEILMHAWVETDPEPFFYDSRFREVF